ncbi:MAG: hypothetical protein IT233_10975 [Bacteroidia bacterium]|nr:hypothetical protein [Bacteroidia bacterium]
MNHSQFLEVGIGLVFVFLLMAIMVSAAGEFITTVISKRGKFLRDALQRALNDPMNKNYAELLYDHPLIDVLKFSQKRPPSYISSGTFAMALTDVIAAQARTFRTQVEGDRISVDTGLTADPLKEFEAGLNSMNESQLKGKLMVFLRNSNGSYDLLKAQTESWFNEYMDRVSGWYRRKTKWRILILSAALTLFMNVDTIDLSVNLWNNAVLRQSVLAAAENYTQPPGAVTDSSLKLQIERIRETYRAVGMLSLPIGWDKQSLEFRNMYNEFKNVKELAGKHLTGVDRWLFVQKSRINFYGNVLVLYLSTITPFRLMGWAFTTIAVSFGAPYWFEFLKRLLAVRNLIKSQT